MSIFKPDELGSFLQTRSSDSKILDHHSFAGVDVGEARTKLLVVSRGEVWVKEFSLEQGGGKRSLSTIAPWLTDHLAGASGTSIVSNLELSELEALASGLLGGELSLFSLQSTRASLFAAEDRNLFDQRTPTLLLDVGWKETRCRLVTARDDDLDSVIDLAPDIVSPAFSAHKMISSILLFMLEYGFIDEVENRKHEEYAAKLLEDLGVKETIQIDPAVFGRHEMDLYEISSIKLTDELLRKPWKSLRKDLFKAKLQSFFREQQVDAVVVSGGVCRLTKLKERLEKDIPGAPPSTAVVGADPGFAAVVGMVVYGLLKESETFEDLPEIKSERAAPAPVAAPPDPEIEIPKGDPQRHLNGQYFLRLVDELVPVFSPTKDHEEFTFAPFEDFLAPTGTAPLDLQVFWEAGADGSPMGEWPQFLARESFKVPVGVEFTVLLDLRADGAGDVLVIKVISEGKEVQGTLSLPRGARR